MSDKMGVLSVAFIEWSLTQNSFCCEGEKKENKRGRRGREGKRKGECERESDREREG